MLILIFAFHIESTSPQLAEKNPIQFFLCFNALHCLSKHTNGLSKRVPCSSHILHCRAISFTHSSGNKQATQTLWHSGDLGHCHPHCPLQKIIRPLPQQCPAQGSSEDITLASLWQNHGGPRCVAVATQPLTFLQSLGRVFFASEGHRRPG